MLIIQKKNLILTNLSDTDYIEPYHGINSLNSTAAMMLNSTTIATCILRMFAIMSQMENIEDK